VRICVDAVPFGWGAQYLFGLIDNLEVIFIRLAKVP